MTGEKDASARGETHGAPPHSIDQLRERLRALGYLDARVDRYVLGSAASGAGRARFALAAGIRVGLVAGAMLGVSAAIALAAWAPGFISSRRDAVILGAALSLVFAAIAIVLVSATVLAATWYAARSATLTSRRAHVVANAAGILVALGSAAYLALWWNAARDALTSLTPGWNAAALAIAAAIALLLAHAVSVVILAALARARQTSDINAGGLLSSGLFLAAFGLLLFAGSGALLAIDGGDDETTAAAPIRVVPAGHAMRVVAIDGFDRELSARLDLPALSRLLRGARVPLAPESETPDPARDWTTIATGQPAARHGIASLEGRRAVGIEGRLPQARGAVVETLLKAADLLRLTSPAIASGDQRRDPAFWEVAAAAGLRTAVVNWWATWPAPAGDNIVVTDRALLRLDTGGELDGEIAPAALYAGLRAMWQTMRQRAEAAALAEFGSIADADLRAVMVRSAEIDGLSAAIAMSLGGSPQIGPLDLRVVYLPGLDIAQHQLFQPSAPASVSAMSERVAAIERYYRFLDGLVARLLPPSERHLDAAILWPGRVAGREGALMLAGDAVTPGETCAACDGAGAAATLLYLLGLPIAEDLASSVAVTVISDSFARAHEVRRVPDYRAVAPRAGAREGRPLDAEALERLRSLGYIR